jgi:hypothetical protein
VDGSELSENGNGLGEGVLRFESVDTGDEVLVYVHATDKGHVSLALWHEMDGNLETFMDPKVAEELALELARAADTARQEKEEEE